MAKAATNRGPQVNWDDVPDSNLIPAAATLCKIIKCEVITDKKGKLVYVARLAVTKPKDVLGRTHFERCYVGTEDDPQAEDPATWAKFGAQRLKKFITAANGGNKPRGKGSPAQAFLACEGMKVDVKFTTKEEPPQKPDGTANSYAGNINQVTDFFPAGTLDYGMIEESKSTSKPAKAAPRKAREPEPEVDEDEEFEDEEGEDEDDEGDEGDEENDDLEDDGNEEGDEEDEDDGEYEDEEDEEDEDEEEEPAPPARSKKAASKKR